MYSISVLGFLDHGLVETDILFYLFSESIFSAFQERYAVGAPQLFCSVAPSWKKIYMLGLGASDAPFFVSGRDVRIASPECSLL